MKYQIRERQSSETKEFEATRLFFDEMPRAQEILDGVSILTFDAMPDITPLDYREFYISPKE